MSLTSFKKFQFNTDNFVATQVSNGNQLTIINPEEIITPKVLEGGGFAQINNSEAPIYVTYHFGNAFQGNQAMVTLVHDPINSATFDVEVSEDGINYVVVSADNDATSFAKTISIQSGTTNLTKYKSFRIHYKGPFADPNNIQIENLTLFVAGDGFAYREYNVEFDDALLDLDGWKNSRYDGVKLTGQKINEYNAGDITYGKNPVIERKTTALYIGNTLIGAEDEDPQYTFIKGHSYVNINKILIVDPENNEVTIIDSKAEDFTPFQQFVTSDFPTGASFSFRLLDNSVQNSLDENYFVKMNKGWLLKSFDYQYVNDYNNPLTEPNPLFLAKGNENSDGTALGKFFFQIAIHPAPTDAGSGDYFPSYASASIIRNKFVNQYYDLNRPTTFLGYAANADHVGIVSASNFLLSESTDFLQNQGRFLGGNSNTEMHLTLFQGSYDFAPGFNDERSISTFEIDRNNSSKGFTFVASALVPGGGVRYPIPIMYLKGKSFNAIDKQGEDPRFLPTFSSSTHLVEHHRRASNNAIFDSYSSSIDIYVRGNANPTGSYSGSFNYQVSFLDKAPTIISNIDKEVQLYDGVGERGFVLIPNQLDQRVKDNVEFYLEKAGLIDKTSRNKAPDRGI